MPPVILTRRRWPRLSHDSVPRGDWKPADVVALMDDIAAVTTIPLETTMDHIARRTLRRGQPLPAALAKADWGEPLPGGLRMAFLLEPRAEQYHLGTEVKARILLHNSGKDPVAFITRSFHQPGHKAKRADGQEFEAGLHVLDDTRAPGSLPAGSQANTARRTRPASASVRETRTAMTGRMCARVRGFSAGKAMK